MEKIEVVSPVGDRGVELKSIAPRLDTLEGKTICETWNRDFKGDVMFPVYRELLKERYPGIKIIPYTEFPSSILTGTPELQRKVSRQISAMAVKKGCDAMISGNGG
ncbi:MAG: hypothetical protein JRI77_16875 [Deltaproteobacteria bacterium]|nr:hypothetical protein [Deltaproteobacteria bacterium]